MKKNPVVRVAFLDVGQGDTIVISLPETKEAVIVDCIDANAVVNYLKHEGIKHLRGLLVTHLHLDHYSGVVQLLENIKHELNLDCERVFFHAPKLSNSLRDRIFNDEDGHAMDDAFDEKTLSRKRRSSIQNLLRWAKHNKRICNDLTKQSGLSLPLEDVIELVHPWYVEMTELLAYGLNNTSGIMKIKGSHTSALLTGDIEPKGWESVDRTDLRCDVLKFPHHGAWKDEDVTELLDVVEPTTVVISVGTNGSRYDHPNQHVFEALSKSVNIRLLCTQATEKCSRLIKAKRLQIADSFKKEAESNNDFFFSSQSGCSCAGTVVIELGESVRVLQPRLEFHQNEIIKRFYENHQCDV